MPTKWGCRKTGTHVCRKHPRPSTHTHADPALASEGKSAEPRRRQSSRPCKKAKEQADWPAREHSRPKSGGPAHSPSHCSPRKPCSNRPLPHQAGGRPGPQAHSHTLSQAGHPKFCLPAGGRLSTPSAPSAGECKPPPLPGLQASSRKHILQDQARAGRSEAHPDTLTHPHSHTNTLLPTAEITHRQWSGVRANTGPLTGPRA